MKRLAIVIFLASPVVAQNALAPGQPKSFYFNSTVNLGLLNGKNGWTVPVPTNTPFQLTLNVQLDEPNPQTIGSGVNILIRCGSDISETTVDFQAVYTSDTAGVVLTGNSANFVVNEPSGVSSGTCYIAMYDNVVLVAGVMTANLQPLPSGTSVTVPSLGDIYLANQPPATKHGNNSAPANLPTQATVSITPGQAINIFGSGLVNATSSEGGKAGRIAAALGLAAANVPANSLVGVFLGPTTSTTAPPGLDFSGNLLTVQTVYPQLQQVFYIGTGMSAALQPRVFVPPAGATQLFLASAGGGISATGSFTAYITPASAPAAPAAGNPLVVSALADLYLLDQPSRTLINTGSSGTTTYNNLPYATAFAPYDSPVQVPITLVPGQTLSFRTIGTASLGVTGTSIDPTTTSAANGITAVSAIVNNVAGGLAGVFVGDTLNPSTPTPVAAPSSTSMTPALQQAFNVGAGLDSKGNVISVTIPAGATRLFLAVPGGGIGSTGAYNVVVTPNSQSAPVISAGGIVSNAGFGKAAVAPGSMVAIFGSNFGPESFPSAVPLPTTLGNTQVFFNTYAAPLFYVGPTQIVAQVPYELYGQTQALVTVITNGFPSLGQPVSLLPMSAGIFTTGSNQPVIIDNNTGALVSPSSPASRGDTLIIWATGLGPTALDPATGYPAPGTASPTQVPISVNLKSSDTGTAMTIASQYAGLAPNFVGLDQINLQLPANAPTGSVVLQLLNGSTLLGTPVVIGIQ